MTTDLDTRITDALGTIAAAAVADRNPVLQRVLLDGARRNAPRRVGPVRPVTLAAGVLTVGATLAAVVVLSIRDDALSPAATPPSVPVTTAFDPTQFNPTGIESPLVYVVAQGDTTSSLAYHLCTSVPALAAWNNWPDELAHVIADGELVSVPSGACIKGTSLTPAPTAATSPGPITVIGDADAGRVSAALAASGFEINDRSKISSGLARPDFYDWPATIDDLLPTIPASSTVVMVIGGNDGQALQSVDRELAGLQPETPEWFNEYAERVRTLATSIVTAGHPLVWVGAHGTQVGETNQQMVDVNDATERALENVPGVLYVSTWDVLRGPSGASPSETVVGEDGVILTALDPQFGGTLTDAGVHLLTLRVVDALRIGAPPSG